MANCKDSLDLQKKIKLRSIYRLRNDPRKGEFYLLFPEGIIELNETSAAILALCNGEHDFSQIIAALVRLYGEDLPSEEVIAFLRQAHEQRLIYNA